MRKGRGLREPNEATQIALDGRRMPLDEKGTSLGEAGRQKR